MIACPSLFSLQPPPISLTAFRTNSSRRNPRFTTSIRASSSPPPDDDDPHAADSLDALSACKTLTQLWAIVLPLGYGGLPLAAQALGSIPGGQSFAALGIETAVLGGVSALLSGKQYKFSEAFKGFTDPKTIGIGLLAGIAALLINQLLFSSSTTDATADVAAVLNNGSFAATAALFTASTLLAPATEELIYRGFFLNALLAAKLPIPAAISASALAFSAAHLDPAAFGQLLVVGLALGAAAATTPGSIAASFIGHATYNSALFLNLFLQS